MDDELEEENLEDQSPSLADELKEEAKERIKEKIKEEAKKKVKEVARKAVKKIAQKVTKQAATQAARAAIVAAAPYILIALLIIAGIAIVIYVVSLFLGALNGISSLAGGSIFLPANHDNPEHIAIVESLVNKRDGNVDGHKLVIYNEGKKDIEWKWNINAAGEKEYYHLLDIRLLKTLDYLTDKHERIKIGMLRTNAPDYLYDTVRMPNPETGEIEEFQKETVSALHTGQAMAIVEIDISRIRALVPRPPIQMFWQKTFAEALTRPIWEEIAFSVGYLDKNVPVYQVIANQGAEGIADVVERYKLDVSLGNPNMYQEAFKKIDRILKLLEDRVFRVRYWLHVISVGLIHTLDARAGSYASEAGDNFKELQGLIGDYKADDFDVSAAILALGQNAELIREGARSTYKATQVANMVNWNRKISVTLLDKKGCLSFEDCIDPFRWWKAYESRNKIRQTIKELLQMPAETSLGGTETEDNEEESITADFDVDLVVKQIITFSPEDDLDNGLERLDIFPRGIEGVGVGGISFGTYGNDPESPDDSSQQAIGDGEYTYADVHFSHMPIDNGVFSKAGTSYVYKTIEADDPWWEIASHLIFKTPFSALGAVNFFGDKIHDAFVGGCPPNLSDISWWFNVTKCHRVSYRDFLFVAF